MNIFAVDDCPIKSAKSLSDRHIVKMVSESCKMLSLALRNKWNNEGIPSYVYEGSGYLNHPCSQWVRNSKHNFAWLTVHAITLISEYEKRFNNTDKFVRAKQIVNYCGKLILNWQNNGEVITVESHSPFVMAIPEEFMSDNPVASYRAYYLADKLVFKDNKKATWRLNKPEWIPEIIN